MLKAKDVLEKLQKLSPEDLEKFFVFPSTENPQLVVSVREIQVSKNVAIIPPAIGGLIYDDAVVAF